MGIIFGRTGTKEPLFTVLKKTNMYEIRRYPPFFVAEVVTSENELNDSFRELAGYIGVFGTPENEKVSSIAMTSPVITTTENSPETGSDIMQFVLPERFTDIEDIPKPTNRRVTIRPGADRLVAVSSFSGFYNREYAMEKRNELYSQLQKDNFFEYPGKDRAPSVALSPTISDLTISSKPIEESVLSAVPTDLKWYVAQYHPPFTLPFLRRNEIWIELNRSATAASELMDGKSN